VDKDLETICLKCLRKEPMARFASAEALAQDLERWLAGKPIQARPVGRWERTRKWLRRHKVAVSVTALVTFGLLTAGLLTGWQWQRAAHLDIKRELEAAENLLVEERALGLAKLAHLTRRHAGNRVISERLLNAVLNRTYLIPVSRAFPGVVRSSQWSASGRFVLLNIDQQEGASVQLRTVTGDIVTELPPVQELVSGVDFEERGGIIATATTSQIRVRAQQSGQSLFEQTYTNQLIRSVCLLPENRLLTVVADRVSLWDIWTHQALRIFPARGCPVLCHHCFR
jgi:hypothetical protein